MSIFEIMQGDCCICDGYDRSAVLDDARAVLACRAEENGETGLRDAAVVLVCEEEGVSENLILEFWAEAPDGYEAQVRGQYSMGRI